MEVRVVDWFKFEIDAPGSYTSRALEDAFPGRNIPYCLIRLWCAIYQANGADPERLWRAVDRDGRPWTVHKIQTMAGIPADDWPRFLAVLLETDYIDRDAWERQELAIPDMKRVAGDWARRKMSGTDTRGAARSRAEHARSTTAAPLPLDLDLDQTASTQIASEKEEDRREGSVRGENPHGDAPSKPHPATFVADWNNTCPKLPKIEALPDKRHRFITAIQRKHSRDACIEVFQFVNNDPFYNGTKPSENEKYQHWQADVDYVIRPGIFEKLLEKARHRRSRSAAPQRFDAHLPPAAPGARRENKGTHIVEFSNNGGMRVLPNANKARRYGKLDELVRQRSGLAPAANDH